MKNTADIVVIGGGPAGMATALEASKNGASVLLLEADILLGGNAARSTGYLAFQGFEMQHREGLDDNAEIFFKDMVAEIKRQEAVSYTHLRAHETRGNLVCRLLLEKKK